MFLSGNKSKRGSMLAKAVVTTAVLAVSSVGLLKMSQFHSRKQNARVNREDAYFCVENAILEGMKKVADQEEDADEAVGIYYLSDLGENLDLPYDPTERVGYMALKIEPDPMGVDDNYLLTASAQVEDKMRSMRALVRWHPSSKVFDYQYFLNNWGWWWGGSIAGWGHNRSNWDFDFKYNPYVNGHIFANGQIESNRRPVNPFSHNPPFRGPAGNDPLTYCHVGARRIPMPNLMDLSYYESSCQGTVVQDGETIIDAVHGDDEDKPGMYLEGTRQDPIEIDGNVVIRGDLIIKGYVTGQGVFYVGGNMYIAGDIEYANGPDFSDPPETMDPDDRDAWVDNNMDKDLVGYAVRESIYAGMVNTGSWRNSCYYPWGYGLRYVGDESELGADGISGTPDDGVDYLDTNGDGVPDSAWYDADGDGVIDDNYDYNQDIKMTNSRISQIARYPRTGRGNSKNYKNYNHVSNDHLLIHEGVFYTNHAFAYRSRRGPDNFHGSLICRDEAIIFNRGVRFKYDSRIHSRYVRKYYEGDPNRIIDLQLPIVEDVSVLDRYEITPREIF